LLGTFGLSPKPCGAGGLADINSLASRKWKFSSVLNKKVGPQHHAEEKLQADEGSTIPSSAQRGGKKPLQGEAMMESPRVSERKWRKLSV
jgi:hypothetical protein